MTVRRVVAGAALALAAGLAGSLPACSSSKDEPTRLSREELLDPVTCARCHSQHYEEWAGSMHAYAAEDPVFFAMNRELQRETNGAIGDFCVKCHAPMAVIDKKAKTADDLPGLPAKYRGVTCFFCHTVESVGELHNNGLRVSNEPTMRGSFSDPVPNDAHAAMGSALHDQRKLVSSDMCGSCHDIVTAGGAHIERTFFEWRQSLFATETGQTCGQCHMRASTGLEPIANAPGVFARTRHSHTFAGVDRALTPFPHMAEQKQEIQELLDTSLQSSLCVSVRGQSSQLRVVLDSVFAGHAFPSGAAADRRMWIELVATRQGEVVYQTGVVPPGTPVLEGPSDPGLWLLRDKIFGPTGEETHAFGLATCYESALLPAPVTSNRADPRFYQRNVVRDFPSVDALIPTPDTVRMKVHIIPVGLEVLDELIHKGDLDPAVRDRMEPMQIGTELVWTPGAGERLEEQGTRTLYECVTATNQDFRANKFPLVPINTCKRP